MSSEPLLLAQHCRRSIESAVSCRAGDASAAAAAAVANDENLHDVINLLLPTMTCISLSRCAGTHQEVKRLAQLAEQVHRVPQRRLRPLMQRSCYTLFGTQATYTRFVDTTTGILSGFCTTDFVVCSGRLRPLMMQRSRYILCVYSGHRGILSSTGTCVLCAPSGPSLVS